MVQNVGVGLVRIWDSTLLTIPHSGEVVAMFLGVASWVSGMRLVLGVSACCSRCRTRRCTNVTSSVFAADSTTPVVVATPQFLFLWRIFATEPDFDSVPAIGKWFGCVWNLVTG